MKAIRGLELCLKVRERERLRDSGVVDSCRVTNAGRRDRVPQVVSALFLMLLQALLGSVEVKMPELMLEMILRAFALRLQVRVLELFDCVSLRALGRLQVSVQASLDCLR